MKLPLECDHTGYCSACSTMNHIPCVGTSKDTTMTQRMIETGEKAVAKPVLGFKPDFKLLHRMLTYMRPNGSLTEQRFVEQYIKSLGATPDDGGNYHMIIGEDPILWSCHTDTVHRFGGLAPIALDEEKGMISVHSKSEANCLGADDTAGVWLMVKMIQAKRSGHYVFHRGEECGCIGSKWVTFNAPDMFKGIKYAVALDRRGKDSIITHQWGGRCCSEDFSKSMSAQLVPGMKSDSGGTVTDTAHYTGIVGECTNLSVGYRSQHSSGEDLDQVFLAQLLERLLALDVSKLVAKRQPGEKEKHTSYSWRGRRHDKKGGATAQLRFRNSKLEEDSIEKLVEDFPEQIAKMLEKANYDMEFLYKIIRQYGGKLHTWDGYDEYGSGHTYFC